MSYSAEGLIEIDLEEFYSWIYKNYVPGSYGFLKLGIPRTNKENQTIEINFAVSSDYNPETWKEKPKAVTEWEQ